MFGADLAAALPEMRAHAESRMLDHFEFRLPVGTGWVYDKILGEDVEAYTVLFETKGRIKAATGLATRDEQGGARTIVSTNRELHIPVDSPEVPVGAYAVPLSIHPTSDPTLAGSRLRVAGPSPGSQTTARRLEITEVLA